MIEYENEISKYFNEIINSGKELQLLGRKEVNKNDHIKNLGHLVVRMDEIIKKPSLFNYLNELTNINNQMKEEIYSIGKCSEKENFYLNKLNQVLIIYKNKLNEYRKIHAKKYLCLTESEKNMKIFLTQQR